MLLNLLGPDLPPEPAMFGVLPAYGLYLRHARRIEPAGIEVRFAAPDLRPAFVLDDVDGARFRDCDAQRASEVPAFVLRDVRDFTVRDTRPVADTHFDAVRHKELLTKSAGDVAGTVAAVFSVPGATRRRGAAQVTTLSAASVRSGASR